MATFSSPTTPGHPRGLRSVLHHGAERCPAARRRRVSGLRAVRRQAGEVRPGQQRGDAGVELRGAEAGQRLLQRQPSTRGSARASVGRRRGHRAHGQRRLLQRRFSRRSGRQRPAPGIGLLPPLDTIAATTIDGKANCRVVTPFRGQTQLKAFGSYTFPKDFLVSLIFQNISGPPVSASYAAPNAIIAPSLGRNLAGRRPYRHGSADRPADGLRRPGIRASTCGWANAFS